MKIKNIGEVVDSFLGQKEIGNLKEFLKNKKYSFSEKEYQAVVGECNKRDENILKLKRTPINRRVVKHEKELSQ